MTKDEIQDGIHTGLSREEYEAIEAINYSTLKHFEKSAAHARQQILHPTAPTAAMIIGSAVHCAILEPSLFKELYVVGPDVNRRTKAGKQEWADFEEANRDKEILSSDDMTLCRELQSSCYAHATATELLSSKGKNEVTLVWTDEKTGLRCKGRLDRITNYADYFTVIDIKTTKSADYHSFRRDCAKFRYHEQAAMYLAGLRAIAEGERRFIHIAVEKEPPYCVCCYELDDDSLAKGKRDFRDHINTYAECRETKVYPGYPDGVIPLRLENWALDEGVGDVID